MTKKEGYKKMIGVYGAVSLAYLISFYESDGIEDYDECTHILAALEEWMKENRNTTIEKRFTRKALSDFALSIKTQNEDIAIQAIRGYSKQVVKFVEDNCS